MSIKQFNATYLAPDDRLLFRFNTLEDAEFRFWLTRRVTLFILAATAHLIVKNLEQTHSPEAAKAIADFEKEAVQVSKGGTAGESQNTPNDQYQPGGKYPLGADPLLVMDVKCTLEKQGLEDLLSMDLVLPGGANINLKMAGPTLQAMCVLLNQLREHALWGEVPQVLDVAISGSNTETDTPESNKPLMH
ncbi:hypothetical protein G6733_05560 [Polynucleobacter paneuropaeus]|nr:hypothetical protein G6733_05560 [Polynucleobacter paneuropaeus]